MLQQQEQILKLKYKSNSDAATAQEVKLSDGLDFKMETLQTATVGAMERLNMTL